MLGLKVCTTKPNNLKKKLLKKIYLTVFLHVHICNCVHAWYPHRSDERASGLQKLEFWVVWSTMWVLWTKLSPLQEQGLLTTEPSPNPASWGFCFVLSFCSFFPLYICVRVSCSPNYPWTGYGTKENHGLLTSLSLPPNAGITSTCLPFLSC